MERVFLVMATAIEVEAKPPIPLRVFQDRGRAEKWQAELIDYHFCPPDMPGSDDSGAWKNYETQLVAWRSAHPAGVNGSYYQRFGIYEVPAA